jgi:chromosome segregation and condensation protein ScpB
MDGQTKRQASKSTRRAAADPILQYLKEQGAIESVKYDEDTGKPYRAFTIDLTKGD